MADSLCPHCRTVAPVVQRGIETRCSACGRARLPLSSTTVNAAGRPAQVGGSLARVLGWISLVGGGVAALTIGAILQAIFPLGIAGYVVGGAVFAVAALVGILALTGGRKLHTHGLTAEREARERAVTALARRQQGQVTPAEAAQALNVSPEVADEVLTAMARRPETAVTLEVEDDGRLVYHFAMFRPRTRVAPVDGSGVRVGDVSRSDDEWAAEDDANAGEAIRVRRVGAPRPG